MVMAHMAHGALLALLICPLALLPAVVARVSQSAATPSAITVTCDDRTAPATTPPKPAILSALARTQAAHIVAAANERVMGTGLEQDNVTIDGVSEQHIFVNGNLARGLLSCPATADQQRAALAWCSHLVGEQAQTRTHNNASDAGFWGVGYPVLGPKGDIYFGDTGTAVTVLAKCYRIVKASDPETAATYLASLEMYARYVRDGCQDSPPGGQGAASPGWILDNGAIGCGYYLGHLSLPPYIIATGTTGAAFFAELAAITASPRDQRDYAIIAANALAWIGTTVRSDGVLPYIIDNETATYTQWPLDTISYVTEGIVAVDVISRRLADSASGIGWRDASCHLRAASAAAIDAFEPTVEWLLRTQQSDGSWGKPHASDTLRSPRVVSLLQWYYLSSPANATMDQAIRDASARFVNYLASNDTWATQDAFLYPGFVAISLADLLE